MRGGKQGSRAGKARKAHPSNKPGAGGCTRERPCSPICQAYRMRRLSSTRTRAGSLPGGALESVSPCTVNTLACGRGARRHGRGVREGTERLAARPAVGWHTPCRCAGASQATWQSHSDGRPAFLPTAAALHRCQLTEDQSELYIKLLAMYTFRAGMLTCKAGQEWGLGTLCRLPLAAAAELRASAAAPARGTIAPRSPLGRRCTWAPNPRGCTAACTAGCRRAGRLRGGRAAARELSGHAAPQRACAVPSNCTRRLHAGCTAAAEAAVQAPLRSEEP